VLGVSFLLGVKIWLRWLLVWVKLEVFDMIFALVDSNIKRYRKLILSAPEVGKRIAMTSLFH
jgi:hypothetical protein